MSSSYIQGIFLCAFFALIIAVTAINSRSELNSDEQMSTASSISNNHKSPSANEVEETFPSNAMVVNENSDQSPLKAAQVEDKTYPLDISNEPGLAEESDENTDSQYLGIAEYYDLQGSLIETIMGSTDSSKYSSEDLPTAGELGLTPEQLITLQLLSTDEIAAINGNATPSMFGDPVSGSLLAGPTLTLNINRGDNNFTKTINHY